MGSDPTYPLYAYDHNWQWYNLLAMDLVIVKTSDDLSRPWCTVPDETNDSLSDHNELEGPNVRDSSFPPH